MIYSNEQKVFMTESCFRYGGKISVTIICHFVKCNRDYARHVFASFSNHVIVFLSRIVKKLKETNFSKRVYFYVSSFLVCSIFLTNYSKSLVFILIKKYHKTTGSNQNQYICMYLLVTIYFSFTNKII
jgi:hypothetical protein